jgi:hypothetical protein
MTQYQTNCPGEQQRLLQEFLLLMQENPTDESIFAHLKDDKSAIRGVTWATIKTLLMQDTDDDGIIIDGDIEDGDYLKYTGLDSFGRHTFAAGALNENGEITSDKTISVPPDSLVVGGLTFSQAGENVQVDSSLFNTKALLLQRKYTVAGGSEDIDNNAEAIADIRAKLQHALLNLNDEVVQVLENEVSVTEEATPTVVASAFNKGLTSAGTQTIFHETSPNSPSGGMLNSKPIIDNSANDRYRKKLVYLQPQIFTNQTYLSAFDGVTTRGLVTYINGRFFAKVFVPAIPASTVANTIYPAPATRMSGPGIWIDIPALTFQNGIPVPEADEVFFTRNIPPEAVFLTVQYRGHANGNVFGEGSTLLSVGGSTETVTTFVLDDGSEQATVEVRWYPSSRSIRVSVTERVNTGLPTINDVEVILSYTETRTVPATPATTRDVEIEFTSDGYQVFGVKPSASGNLVLVGDETEVDTNYAYTTLFGVGETGYLTVVGNDSVFFDYEDIDIISTTVTALESRSTLPQFGLFTTQYSHETILHLMTQLEVRDSSNVAHNVGDVLTDLLDRVTTLET